MAASASANILPDEPETPLFPPEKRRSFFARLFGRRPVEPTIGDLLAEAWERQHTAEPDVDLARPIPVDAVPTLLAKLSELPEEDLPEDAENEEEAQAEPIEETEIEDESGEEPESLTSSVMEVQARLAPEPPHIRSFPWLRG